jgi:hypothetical protein
MLHRVKKNNDFPVNCQLIHGQNEMELISMKLFLNVFYMTL